MGSARPKNPQRRAEKHGPTEPVPPGQKISKSFLPSLTFYLRLLIFLIPCIASSLARINPCHALPAQSIAKTTLEGWALPVRKIFASADNSRTDGAGPSGQKIHEPTVGKVGLR